MSFRTTQPTNMMGATLKRRNEARPKVREKRVPTMERTTPAAMRVTNPTAKNVSIVPMLLSSLKIPIGSRPRRCFQRPHPR